MSYAWDITIPASTTEQEPVKEDLSLGPGVVTKIQVKYPAGCHGLVKVRIIHHTQQLVPLTRSQWLTGDDEAILTEPMFEFKDVPYKLKFEGASPGTTYDHTITVRVTILPAVVASVYRLVQVAEKMYTRLFGK